MTSLSPIDKTFRDRFEEGRVGPREFGHREHLQLAFAYLCGSTLQDAHKRMRGTLFCFLRANGVPEGKYHETLTVSWLGAVRHFMNRSPECASFGGLLAADDRLLDTSIMLTHYRQETLFSSVARAKFVAPDLQPIPGIA